MNMVALQCHALILETLQKGPKMSPRTLTGTRGLILCTPLMPSASLALLNVTVSCTWSLRPLSGELDGADEVLPVTARSRRVSP